MGRNMATEYGKMSPEIVILVSGAGIWRMAMECTLGRMEIAMKANGCIL